jgi:hypothetical protein
MNVIILNSFLFTDPDAKAFLDVVQLYDQTLNELAVQNFVKNYRAAHGNARLSDIGDTAIYLMYGGTETACCLNLINPSLSNPFNLVKVGTPTFNANGITTTETQYLKTGIYPSTHVTLNNTSLMIYERTNVSTHTISIGAYNTPNNWILQLVPRISITNNFYFDSHNTTTGRLTGTGITDSRGLTIGSRLSSLYAACFIDGKKKGSISTSGGNLVNYEIYIGARNNNGTATVHRSNNYAFAAVALGKTDAQCIAITNAVNQFQTELGRAV